MYINISCAQMEVIPGHPDRNFKRMLEIIKKAREDKANILLFPEMCIPGYLIGDVWEQQAFLDDCAYYAREIAAASGGLCVMFGSVAFERDKLNEDGRVRKYNAAFAAQDGKLLKGYLGRDFIMKNSLPNYREFDDCRYFYSLQKLCYEEGASVKSALKPLELAICGERVKIGLMLCEDGWTKNYHLNVPQTLAANGADILFNLSCSPYALGKNKKRNRLFSKQAKDAGIPLIYCNNVGIQNNGKNVFTYDGCTSVYDGTGKLVTSAGLYDDTLLSVKWDAKKRAIKAKCGPAPLPEEPESVYRSLKYGTEKFLAQCGIKKMTLGLSGGIDSAVAAAMYCHILGPENVLLLNLPSEYNSDITKALAEKIAANLSANYAVIPIWESSSHTAAQLSEVPVRGKDGKTFNLKLSGLIMENIQARDRGARIIAAAAAAFGGAFSCNSNKAEIAIGYATFYGDICGVLAIFGDIWKFQVYALGRYLNEKIFRREVIPEEIFNIRPSAELSPEQTVGKGGDPLIYEYHDYLLRAFIENWHKTTSAEILRWYRDGILAEKLGCSEKAFEETFNGPEDFIEDLERWWKLFAGFSVAKRIQAPPVLSITKRAFGYDHREAQLEPYFPRDYAVLKKEILKK
ncbi:MAG: NAD(+) synthase [Phascolarctobacterium sp.]|nr:NAD(+) synthase [Phascolarctobacterium sp.]